ncbi:MAG: hypothetical protein DRO06_00290 [Thermoproteota archaeon]|nr:MAG: hypothetical protein DRO06_00290 [Candidatus Korarchaeota archaeon]
MDRGVSVPSRILVLSVDIDDDLGRKTGIRGPVIGREQVIQAALKLITQDPSEADANAMFMAVKEFDELKRSFPNVDVEVAVVTGRAEGGMEASREFERQLSEVFERFRPTYVVFVSDGSMDEQVIPRLYALGKGVEGFGVHISRVVVQQSESIESTFMLMKGYLKKLLTEPAYAPYSIGIPGLLILTLVVTSLLGMERYLLTALTAALGAVLLFKGFRLDERISSLLRGGGASRRLGIVSLLAGSLMMTISALNAYERGVRMLRYLPFVEVIAEVLKGSSVYFFLSVAVVLSGWIVGDLIERRSPKDKMASLATAFSLLLVAYFSGLYMAGDIGLPTLILGYVSSAAFLVASVISIYRRKGDHEIGGLP